MNLDAKEFAAEVIETANSWECTTMEAVLIWCEKYGVEPEMAGAAIRKHPTLKARIQEEAEILNFLKPTGAKLPL